MTEQEAIESLEEINKNYFQPDENEFDDINEALNMAIQELKKRNLAVEDLENYMQFEDECVKKGFSFNSLLEAREKQIAKKPVTYKSTNRADCPCCNATVRGIREPFGNWCSKCGQKIDWSDKSEQQETRQ